MEVHCPASLSSHTANVEHNDTEVVQIAKEQGCTGGGGGGEGFKATPLSGTVPLAVRLLSGTHI